MSETSKSGKRGRIVTISFLFLLVLSASLYLLSSDDGRPNVLLIVVDTLRADRLSCYGWKEETSPNIDRLASGGVLAERMICQVPQTLPSFCTILTGTYPPSHGVRGNGRFALSPDAKTLAEIFRDEGYRTGAFLAGFPLDSRFGLDQGFETYVDSMQSHRPMGGMKEWEDGSFLWLGNTTENFENTADVMTGRALEWLRHRKKSPFFLMVHYFDPHHNYAPPERFDGRFEHAYSGEIAFVDEQIGLLLDELEEGGLDRSTLVLFTADHGECLGEQGRRQHQEHLTEAAVHVPFVARMPGSLSANSTLDGLCRSVDILPTILELVGISPPAAAEGRSLLPALSTGRTDDPPCYFETLYGLMESNTGIVRRGITDGRWKYVRNERRMRGQPAEAINEELYDLSADPDEVSNLAVENRDSLQDMIALFDAFVSEHPERRAEVLRPDKEAMKKLKALGYF